MTKVSKAERETVITRSEAEQEWHVFTEDRRVIRKLERLFGPGTKKGALGLEWTVPKSAVSLRKPPRASEKSKREAAARLLAHRESQNALAQGQNGESR